MADFDELVAEAMTAPFSGWDFSWLDRHTRTEPLPWDYWVRVAALARTLPLGIAVVQDEGARDNDEQNGSAGDRGRLPFRDGSFGLVCNRHDSFRAAEVSRVLAPGGTFVTQQVDYHWNDDLARVLATDNPGLAPGR